MTAPVEVSTRYATVVDDLPAAWTFVMGRVDLVGPSPNIGINPIRQDSDDGRVRLFEVVVQGTIEEEQP